MAVVGVALAVWWCRGGRSFDDDGVGERGSSSFARSSGRLGARNEAASASLSGRVIQAATHAGIPGAVITISPAGIDYLFQPRDELPLLVVANDGGEWRTAIAPGKYIVAAAARGFIPEVREDVVVTSQANKLIEVALEAGGSVVRGAVSDIGGGGISNVRITARSGEGRNFSTLTKGDGVYELTMAPGSYGLVAQHEDYVEQRHQIALGSRGVAIEDFVLSPGAVIRGQVIAADSNKPVPDAEVSGERPNRFGYWGSSTRADGNGVFTLRGAPSGPIEITALADGYASAKPTIVELGVAEQADIRLIVGRGFSIRGRVVTKGKPAQGIREVGVRAMPAYRERLPLTLGATDADGRFTIVGALPGFYELDTYGNAAINSGYMRGVAVEVVDRDINDVLIELDRGVRVVGRLDPPTRGRAWTNGGDGLQCGGDEVEVDDSGRFVFEHQRVGRCVVVARTKDGRGGKVDVTFSEDAKEIVVNLEPLSGISGRVIDGAGGGVAGINVSIQRTGGWNAGDPKTVSSSDGSFAFKGIEPGKLTVLATHSSEYRDGLGGEAKSAPIDVVAGVERSDVTLIVVARDRSLHGVVMRDGKPVPDARVSASREDYSGGGGPQVVTKADGTFVMERVIDAQYTLVADDPRGTARAEVTNVKPGSSTTLVLLPNGILSGRVTVDGAPLHVFDLSCWKRDGDQGYLGKHFDSPDGTYTLERVPVGSYGCNIRSVDGRASEKIVVSSDSPARLDFSIERWATVTGYLVDVITGAPVGDVVVYTGAGEDDVRAGRNRPTDVNGRFSVPGVFPGSISLFAVSRDWSEMTRIRVEGTLAPGQHFDLGRIEVVTPFPHPRGQLGMAGRLENNALVITEVTGGGAADRAGIRVADVISTFDGRSMVKLYPHLSDLLVAGKTYALGTTRGGVSVTALPR